MSKTERDLLGAAMAQQADQEAVRAVCYVIGKRRKERDKGKAEKVFEFRELCKGLEHFDQTGRTV